MSTLLVVPSGGEKRSKERHVAVSTITSEQQKVSKRINLLDAVVEKLAISKERS